MSGHAGMVKLNITTASSKLRWLWIVGTAGDTETLFVLSPLTRENFQGDNGISFWTLTHVWLPR